MVPFDSVVPSVRGTSGSIGPRRSMIHRAPNFPYLSIAILFVVQFPSGHLEMVPWWHTIDRTNSPIKFDGLSWSVSTVPVIERISFVRCRIIFRPPFEFDCGHVSVRLLIHLTEQLYLKCYSSLWPRSTLHLWLWETPGQMVLVTMVWRTADCPHIVTCKSSSHLCVVEGGCRKFFQGSECFFL